MEGKSENVLVTIRFRPPSKLEQQNNGLDCVKFPTESAVDVSSPAGNKTFAYDRVFGPNSRQDELFSVLGVPLLSRVLEGFNGTLLTYGQTGSGKTHTMMGPEGGKSDALDASSQLYHERGMVESLFERLRGLSQGIEWSVRASYVELYMENFRDLLAPPNEAKEMKLRDDILDGRGVFLENALEVPVEQPVEVLALLQRGISLRKTFSTAANDTSSRSHTIFILNVVLTDHAHGGARTRSRLTLVDLAGSERVGKTLASGQRLEEAKKINLSLTLLGNVINKLTDGTASHVPYRDSKLTRLLQDSLGGNSLTTLLCNCSPSSFNLSETISTLMFASRAKQIKNKPKVNRDLSMPELKAALARALEEIRVLKLRIAALEAGGAGSGASGAGGGIGSSGIGGGVSGGASGSGMGYAGVNASMDAGTGPDIELENKIVSLSGEITSLKEELLESASELAKSRQEVDYFKQLSQTNDNKFNTMQDKWKEESRMAKYWITKYQQLKGETPVVVKKKKKTKTVIKSSSTGSKTSASGAAGSKTATPRKSASGSIGESPRPIAFDYRNPGAGLAITGTNSGKPPAMPVSSRSAQGSSPAASGAAPPPPPLMLGESSDEEDGDEEGDEDEDNARRVEEAMLREKELREQLDAIETRNKTLEKQVALFLTNSSEADEIIDLLKERVNVLEEEAAKQSTAIGKSKAVAADFEKKVLSIERLYQESETEIRRLQALLRDNNIAYQRANQEYGGRLKEFEDTNQGLMNKMSSLERSKAELEAQKRRFQLEMEQREAVTIIEIDLDVQAKDIPLLENEIYLFRMGFEGDKEKEIARLRNEVRRTLEYITSLKSMLEVQFVNPMDFERARQLLLRIKNLAEVLEAARLQLF